MSRLTDIAKGKVRFICARRGSLVYETEDCTGDIIRPGSPADRQLAALTNIKCPICGCWTWGEIGKVCKGDMGGWGSGPHEPVAMIEKRSTSDRRPSMDEATAEALWTLTPNWDCPHCKAVNLAIREKCRTCGYDSNAGEFPWYNPLPPYDSANDRAGGE